MYRSAHYTIVLSTYTGELLRSPKRHRYCFFEANLATFALNLCSGADKLQIWWCSLQPVRNCEGRAVLVQFRLFIRTETS
jgi:hypothetical protein